jgi:hypothetical protein
MTSRHRRLRDTALPTLLPILLLAASLGGCNTYQRFTPEDREALATCNTDADRQFAARHRDLISERDGSASPLSGNTLPYNPNAGLSDEYEQQQLVDSCLARSAAGAAVVPGTNPAKP